MGKRNDRLVFLLAAPRGAGKSTLIRSGFDRLIELVGDDVRGSLFDAFRDATRRQYSDFGKAFDNGSYFHAQHVPLLRNATISKSILIHLDLANVLRNLVVNSDYLSTEQTTEIVTRGFEVGKRRTNAALRKREVNDTLMQNFLRDPLYRQFDGVVGITLRCDYERNQEQLRRREGRYGFGHPSPSAPQIHAELYDCWQRNLPVLNLVDAIEVTFQDEDYQRLA